jgi:hypothetical protein
MNQIGFIAGLRRKHDVDTMAIHARHLFGRALSD